MNAFMEKIFGKRNPLNAISFVKPARVVRKVYVHCSASDNPKHDDISVIKEWHLARGFTDVGYHYFIKRDGSIQIGRPLSVIPSAQKGHNTNTIAICLHGLEEDKFSPEQFYTLQRLCVLIDAAYYGALTFHGHNEVSTKTCPVFDYRKVLKLSPMGYLCLK